MFDQILEGHYAGRGETRPPRRIRILNWNIERGQNLAAVMKFAEREQPDLCIFQEVDLNAHRTGRRNVADLFAARFGFNYAFGIEFQELSQGSDDAPAFQGQAVFARCAITAPRILRFRRQSDFWHPHWFLPRWPALQPRTGGRMALVVELAYGPARLVVYNIHLESKGDDLLRMSQLSEAVHDSSRYPPNTPVVLAGDMNTRHSPSPLARYLLASGFADACRDSGCRGTKPNGWTLDWIFTRGPAACTETAVYRDINASDHYPLCTSLTLSA